MNWDPNRWPHFAEREVACQCCGELLLDEFCMAALDALERLRKRIGPLTVLSGHRCEVHNSVVGGARDSMHLRIAFDLAINGYDLGKFHAAAVAAGFTGFGFMERGLHCDTGAARAWDYGPQSRRNWAGIIPAGTGTFEVT